MYKQYDYEELIRDAEWRIGSYIASGGSSNDEYVKEQVRKIQDWLTKQYALERKTTLAIINNQEL